MRADLAASIDSFITKEQEQLTASRQKRESQAASTRRDQIEDELDFVENKEQFDMQESVSDILKKFKEDQERILNEGLLTGSVSQRELDSEDLFKQPETTEEEAESARDRLRDSSSSQHQQQPLYNKDLYDDLDQEPTSQKNFQEYIDMFENYVNTFNKK